MKVRFSFEPGSPIELKKVAGLRLHWRGHGMRELAEEVERRATELGVPPLGETYVIPVVMVCESGCHYDLTAVYKASLKAVL